ncbi:MAG: M15 family metallopeptidase [Pseudomonadota bacterium]
MLPQQAVCVQKGQVVRACWVGLLCVVLVGLIFAVERLASELGFHQHLGMAAHATTPIPRKKPQGGVGRAPSPAPSAAPPSQRNAAPSQSGAPTTQQQGSQQEGAQQRGFFGRVFGRNGSAAGRSGGRGKRQALLAAYPGAFRFEGNMAVFPNGQRIAWDDGRQKSPAERLTNPDLEDMFHYPYPRAGSAITAPKRHHDPGRVRSDPFFRALYGNSQREVAGTVRTINWVPRLGGGTLPVTTKFGIDRKLTKVSAELERLPSRFHAYLRPSAGTFLWRRIAGTNRLSVHSFGAAIDINTRYANYWRWDGQSGDAIAFRNQIPLEIITIFEKHCFIWGGRWYHYDTMHFEYRPELLPGCQR